MTADFDTFRSFRGALADHGFPPGLPWWDSQFQRYYRIGAKRFAARVGRGGAKSTTMVDASIVEVVAGDWTIPPGEVHYFAFVSQNKPEAGQRLRQIAARLRALGVPFDQSGDEIVLRDMPRGFRVFACQVGAVSGFRCLGFAADEVAKWMYRDSSANPAPEVIASIRAMTVTHPRAREFFVSSPLGMDDAHYHLIEAGDSAQQVVAIAPSWVANPSITEAQTHELEPDERIWRREYAALPQAAALAAFPYLHVERAFLPRDPQFPAGTKVLILDPSSGGHSSRDRFTWAVASWCVDQLPENAYRLIQGRNGRAVPETHPWGEKVRLPEFADWEPGGKPYLAFHRVGAIEGGFAGDISGDEIADHLQSIAREHDVTDVHSDQRESLFLGSALEKRGLSFHPHTWTGPSKAEAVTLVRRWLASGSLSLPLECVDLKRELLAFEEVITPSGSLTFGARRGAHDDYVALLVTAAHAEASEWPLSDSPHRGGHDYPPIHHDLAALF